MTDGRIQRKGARSMTKKIAVLVRATTVEAPKPQFVIAYTYAHSVSSYCCVTSTLMLQLRLLTSATESHEIML
jgi:hypothetical protein